MQLPHPRINHRARALFKKIYRRNKIDIESSKQSLKDQLDLYLDHIGNHIGHKITIRDRKRIFSVIERNNLVASILQTPSYKQVIKENTHMLGNTNLGLVFCIDGRIPALFVGGRFARHYEVPAAEISVIKRKSDGKLIPDSTDLNEALRRVATSGSELLEIVFAHTSLLNPHHGCGAMAAKKSAGLIDGNQSLEIANLKIIKDKTIPSLTNIFNDFREQVGLKSLKTVGVSALYDTDTFGVILNYDLKDKNQSLSTTELTQKYQNELNQTLAKNKLEFGIFNHNFTDLSAVTSFSETLAKIEHLILKEEILPQIIEEINQYLDQHYQELSYSQIKALRFILVRTIVFQYLTGLSQIKRNKLDHPFASHQEAFMSVAMRGATIGKFDPANQAFASTPADPPEAISNINTMLSIMGNSEVVTPYILFVCNSVNFRDLKENNQIVQRLMGSNAGLLRDIIADKKLGEMIEKGEIIPVPVLIEEDSREVLKIADHSAYI